MIAQSLNSLAESRQLNSFHSWIKGKPEGYFHVSDLKSAEGRAAIGSFFKEKGFVVIEEGFNPQEIQDIQNEAIKICRGELGQINGLVPTQPGDTDDEVMSRHLCIHFPHKVSEPLRGVLGHETFADTLTTVIGPNVKCMQSMLFIKSKGKPGQAWHQDEIYIPTRDRSLTGGWIALDDATVENGCLWVIPGSHKEGILYFQEWHADPRFDCSHEARRFPYTNDDAVPVEVKAGSVVFFNGYLLHRSLPNYAKAGYRRALVNHYMSAESLLPWGFAMKEGLDHVAILDNRDVIMIAGEDPYAFKGTIDYHGCHVRPDGKGGCGNFEYNRDAKTGSPEGG